MKIAFCISAYQDPAQLGRLVKRLSGLDSRFYIHIDARVDQGPFERAVADLCERCHFVTRRFRVAWGGFSQVRYQLEMMRAAANWLGPRDRLFLLSGADYPICSAAQMLARLESDEELAWAAPLGRAPGRATDRFRLCHIRDIDLGSRLANRAMIALVREASRLVAGLRKRRLTVAGRDWEIYVGSSYMALTGEAAALILDQIASHPDIIRYFRHSFVPEEMLIPTILFNSPLKQRATLVEGTIELVHLCGTHFFEYPDQVTVFTLADLPRIVASQKLFGRKFASGTSDALMDVLDERWGA